MTQRFDADPPAEGLPVYENKVKLGAVEATLTATYERVQKNVLQVPSRCRAAPVSGGHGIELIVASGRSTASSSRSSEVLWVVEALDATDKAEVGNRNMILSEHLCEPFPALINRDRQVEFVDSGFALNGVTLFRKPFKPGTIGTWRLTYFDDDLRILYTSSASNPETENLFVLLKPGNRRHFDTFKGGGNMVEYTSSSVIIA